MKTTVEIPDSLLEEARKVATRQGTSVRVLIIEGLRRSLAERRRGVAAYRMRRATFKGNGLQPGADTHWQRIRELAYEGRGG